MPLEPVPADRTGSAASVRELLDRAKATELSDAAASRDLVQQARVLAHGQNDQAGEAEAFYRLASLAYYTGKIDEAFAVATDAHELATQCGADVVSVWALNLIGIIHFNAGNHSEALSCCLRALDLYRTTDHRVDEGNLLNTIATIHHSLGDTDRAVVTYEAALDANRGVDRPDLDALTLANMAQLRAERGEFFLAMSLGENALELARASADEFVPEVLAVLGEAYSGLNDAARGQECFDEALRLLDERAAQGKEAPPSALIAVRTGRGKAAIATGDHGRAEPDLLAALELARLAKNRRLEVTAHELLAVVYRNLGRFEEALEHQDARFDLHQAIFNQGNDMRIKALQIAHDTERDRRTIAELRARSDALDDRVAALTADLRSARTDAFERLVRLAEARDGESRDHALRVGDLSAVIARELGIDAEWCTELRDAARLHDIGKVTIPDAILFKPGPFDATEATIMHSHAEAGRAILENGPSPVMRLGAEICQHHHERWDGSGQPMGLRGTEIPLSARIVAVADVFDSLVSARTYKPAWSIDDAVEYIDDARGVLFDPAVVAAFQRVVDASRVGE
jgi:putative two-component system response regulator